MRTPNGKLFVENSIEIKSSAEKVWKVLTDPGFTEEWIKQWWPEIHLESDWKLGSPVFWKADTGAVGAEGQIVFLDPGKVMRFTFQVRDSGTKKQEEITFVLHDQGDRILFTVSVGDFGDTPEHEACYPGAVDSWKRSLPVIKYLAEDL